MAGTAPTPTTHIQEKTFSTFNSSQGANYAQHRLNYHPKLYQKLIDYHIAEGGQLDTVVDVGCGPGIALRSLAPRFKHGFGFDPSEGMISTAQSLGGTMSDGEAIRFEVSTAETIGSDITPPIQVGSVDMIIAATCAHWFDMSRFWPRAAEVLKPGGSVAIWCSSSMRPQKDTPNAAKIQAIIENYQEVLKDYYLPGNIMTRELFVNLPLPWTIPTPAEAFDKASFVRTEYGTDENSEDPTEFYEPHPPTGLKRLEKVLSTASPVIRWQEAHPELIGTDKDVVKVLVNDIAEALHEAGVEKGKELVQGGVQGVLLLVKKKA